MQVRSQIPAGLNIRARLLLLCLGVAMPLMLIACFALWKEYNTLKTEARRATTFQAAISARTLSQWLSTQCAAVRALASVPALQSGNLDSVSRNLSNELATQPGWLEVTVFDLQGNPVGSTSSALTFPGSAGPAAPDWTV